MPLLKRLGFYFIGFSIGIIFLIFFFKNKKSEFCYFPNCRVLKEIRENEFQIDEKAQPILASNKIEEQDIEDILTYGEVNFSESDTHAEPCRTYVIEAIWNEKNITFTVKNCPDYALLENVSVN
ncbi:hypothetical protein SAMN05216480_11624 [Pustulibacterium marinum]|uniref:DUF4258 domain-containing protein n=1 Tax=Pustulibacterium marinum TaxID=1224947 RepID=A0A1I7IGJ1_9FLAO|nr:DUF4258 domain-containing protein [Pustulibacterium marinum]SFU72041.1 hypothetical protein SAMN05216480_11624 [Pustulibacterium marinum]